MIRYTSGTASAISRSLPGTDTNESARDYLTFSNAFGKIVLIFLMGSDDRINGIGINLKLINPRHISKYLPNYCASCLTTPPGKSADYLNPILFRPVWRF